MCGIAGWYARPDEPWRPSLKQVADLLSDIELRGRDATGYGTLKEDGRLFLWKGPVTATEFNKALPEEKFPVGRVGILHTRGASVGEPSDNRNNHPIPYVHKDQAVMIVHNGGVGNLEGAYKILGVEPPAEVDSALIATALAIRGPKEGLEFLHRNSGGQATIAALYKGGKLVLARDSNPLYIAQVAAGAMVWSSCDYYLKRMSVDMSFGVPIIRVNEFKNQYAVVWGEDGAVEWQGDWRLPVMFNPPKFLRWEREEQRDRVADSMVRGVEDKKDKESKKKAKAEEDAARLRALPLATAVPNAKPVDIPKEMEVRCFWNGCSKLARRSVPHSVGGAWRYVALCHNHGIKVVKKGKELVIERSGEVILRKSGVMKGGVPNAG